MRISIEATRRDIAPAFDWIGGLIGAALDKHVAALQQQERKNPLLAQHLRENYRLEFALADARRYRRNTGRLPKGERFDALYGFLLPAYRIRQALPQQAVNPFEGQLTKATSDPNGLRPFAYELSIATHLMGHGWDIEFADYSGLARFDFLASKHSTEIEVECKATSHDLGRKIRRQDANRLADAILPTTEQLMETQGCHLVRIAVPDRLGATNEELSNLATLTATAADRRMVEEGASALVEYTFSDFGSWPEPNDVDFLPFFEKQLGHSNSHLLFCGRPGFSIVAVSIASTKPDKVVKSIAGQAKKAADQCSGTRPAFIALNLAEQLSSQELKDLLTTSSGLHGVAHEVFKNDRRAHVDSIAFTVPQRVRSYGKGATSLSGNLVMLNNPQPKFPCTEIRGIFRQS
jgi:hypothetical protein